MAGRRQVRYPPACIAESLTGPRDGRLRGRPELSWRGSRRPRTCAHGCPQRRGIAPRPFSNQPQVTTVGTSPSYLLASAHSPPAGGPAGALPDECRARAGCGSAARRGAGAGGWTGTCPCSWRRRRWRAWTSRCCSGPLRRRRGRGLRVRSCALVQAHKPVSRPDEKAHEPVMRGGLHGRPHTAPARRAAESQ